MDREQTVTDHVIDLGSAISETKGGGFVDLDLAGTEKIPMGLSDD